jgi:hypothetical protein
MQLKPIALIIVALFMVISLTVAGCTSKVKTASNGSATETPFSAAAETISSDKATDADGNGNIDQNDVTQLKQQYKNVYDTQVEPLLTKTGITFDKDDNVIVKGDLSKLTDTEQQQLSNAVAELNEINLQIKATEIQNALKNR